MSQEGLILHIAPTPFFSDRGCHIRIEGVIRSLTGLGYQNHLCTYHHGRDVDTIETSRISRIKRYTKTSAGPSRYKPWADWKLLWLVVRRYYSLKPVAIHAHLHEGLFIGLIVKWLFFWRGTPLIADMQGSLSGELEAHGSFKRLSFLRWPIRLFEKVLMWAAGYVVCSSQHSLEKIASEFSVPSDKISLVQDGADPAHELSDGRRAELIARHQLPKDRKLVVYSGALLESKGLAILKDVIRATGPLKQKLHFLIIGYPEANLQPYLDENDLSELATLTGQVPFLELADYLGLASVAIDPKNSDAGEGSGKMLNYLACGLPVVAFDTQNNRDFLPEGTPLALSAVHFAELLEVLINDESLAKQTAKANLSQFQTNFSWDVAAGQLNKAYRRVLG